MAGLNRILLIGNLTRDPELRFTQSGTPVAKFGLAVNRFYTSQDGQKKQEVDFIPIVVWGKQAEHCEQYLKKGRQVFIEGRLQQQSWETDKGEKRTTFEVVAQAVQFLGSPRQQDSAAAPQQDASGDTERGGRQDAGAVSEDAAPSYEDKDIPF